MSGLKLPGAGLDRLSVLSFLAPKRLLFPRRASKQASGGCRYNEPKPALPGRFSGQVFLLSKPKQKTGFRARGLAHQLRVYTAILEQFPAPIPDHTQPSVTPVARAHTVT